MERSDIKSRQVVVPISIVRAIAAHQLTPRSAPLLVGASLKLAHRFPIRKFFDVSIQPSLLSNLFLLKPVGVEYLTLRQGL